MAALGILFIYMVYVFLALPIIWFIVSIIIKRKESLKKRIIYLIISAIPFSLFSYNQYRIHKRDELGNIGIYY